VHKKLSRVYSVLLLGSIAAIPGLGRAEMGMGPGDGSHPMMRAGAGTHPHGHMMHQDDGVAGRDWKVTLTEEQKAEIDWITLRLFPRQQLLKAQMDVKEAELNQLIVGDDVVEDQWQTKLDEFLQLKREYLANKYQRMIEVRQVLTPQQRVAYDLAVLSRR
jgi:Spy/CpxP family protein refolding chaperone